MTAPTPPTLPESAGGALPPTHPFIHTANALRAIVNEMGGMGAGQNFRNMMTVAISGLEDAGKEAEAMKAIFTARAGVSALPLPPFPESEEVVMEFDVNNLAPKCLIDLAEAGVFLCENQLIIPEGRLWEAIHFASNPISGSAALCELMFKSNQSGVKVKIIGAAEKYRELQADAEQNGWKMPMPPDEEAES